MTDDGEHHDIDWDSKEHHMGEPTHCTCGEPLGVCPCCGCYIVCDDDACPECGFVLREPDDFDCEEL